MNPSPRIGVFYSHGPHFLRVLKQVRQKQPGATLIAFVPHTFPAQYLEGIVSEVHRTAGTRPAAALKTLRQLRAARLDEFIVMFDSPRLQLLAALSGAPTRACHTVDGRQRPINFQVIRPLLRWATRRIRGQFTYWRIRRIVRSQSLD
ncbi:MAG: hypothetical protein HYV27_24180 [Candidatus Hydrogenedentes bacterium]|nr:hypothetical protein [Candidatus Hydrogenedentota bacterium]